MTTGGSTIRAIDAVREEGHTVCGVVAISTASRAGRRGSRPPGGAPYEALTTIDEVYPGRPDRVAS